MHLFCEKKLTWLRALRRLLLSCESTTALRHLQSWIWYHRLLKMHKHLIFIAQFTYPICSRSGTALRGRSFFWYGECASKPSSTQVLAILIRWKQEEEHGIQWWSNSWGCRLTLLSQSAKSSNSFTLGHNLNEMKRVLETATLTVYKTDIIFINIWKQ